MTVLNPGPRDHRRDAGPTSSAHPRPRCNRSDDSIGRRLRRRHAAGRHAVHQHLGHARQRHQHPARLPRRDPRSGRHPGRRLRLPGPLQQHRHPHARRSAQHPGRHEPRGPEDQPQGPGTGRHPHRQRRRLRRPATCTRPATRAIRWKTARSRATASSRADHQAQSRGRGRAASSAPREADRCKNFFALGLVYWLYERSLEPTLRWIRDKFAKNPAVLEANTRTLKAGYNYGETTEAMPVHYRVPKAKIPPGTLSQDHRQRGRWPSAWSPAAQHGRACRWSTPPIPITPARTFCINLAELKRYGVRTLQAEDEIAAIGMAIGASFGGALGVDRHQRPRHLPQVRGHRPGRHDRAAGGHHRRAARRTQHRPADQDRAGRPAASDVRPQRRMSRLPSSRPARRRTASPWPSRRSAWPSAS